MAERRKDRERPDPNTPDGGCARRQPGSTRRMVVACDLQCARILMKGMHVDIGSSARAMRFAFSDQIWRGSGPLSLIRESRRCSVSDPPFFAATIPDLNGPGGRSHFRRLVRTLCRCGNQTSNSWRYDADTVRPATQPAPRQHRWRRRYRRQPTSTRLIAATTTSACRRFHFVVVRASGATIGTCI